MCWLEVLPCPISWERRIMHVFWIQSFIFLKQTLNAESIRKMKRIIFLVILHVLFLGFCSLKSLLTSFTLFFCVQHIAKQRTPCLTTELMKSGKHLILIRNPLDSLVSRTYFQHYVSFLNSH